MAHRPRPAIRRPERPSIRHRRFAPPSNPPAPISTVVADPTAGSAITVPDTTVPVSALPVSAPVSTVVESTTTVPESTTTVPGPSLLNVVVPPPTETVWTLGLQYIGGTTYTGPYHFYLRNFIAGTTVSLHDGEVSAPLVRALGADYAVRVEMGSSYDPAFPFRWECTGSDSGLQTATTEQFTPAVPATSTQPWTACFIIDNTNPPTIDVVTEVEGDPAGDVSFDYDVRYNFFGDWPIGGHTGGDGATVTYAGLAGFHVEITATHRRDPGHRPDRDRVPRCGRRIHHIVDDDGEPESCEWHGEHLHCDAHRAGHPDDRRGRRSRRSNCAGGVVLDDVAHRDRTRDVVARRRRIRELRLPDVVVLCRVSPATRSPGWDLTGVESWRTSVAESTAPYTDFTTSLEDPPGLGESSRCHRPEPT